MCLRYITLILPVSLLYLVPNSLSFIAVFFFFNRLSYLLSWIFAFSLYYIFLSVFSVLFIFVKTKCSYYLHFGCFYFFRMNDGDASILKSPRASKFCASSSHFFNYYIPYFMTWGKHLEWIRDIMKSFWNYYMSYIKLN